MKVPGKALVVQLDKVLMRRYFCEYHMHTHTYTQIVINLGIGEFHWKVVAYTDGKQLWMGEL